MKLSVVIPTVGRAAVLSRTLAALEQQTLAADAFEVIVVGGAQAATTPGLEPAIAAASRSVRVRYLHSDDDSASAKRNAGWRAAQAPVVLFLGDDILAVPRLLDEHMALHERFAGSEPFGVVGLVQWAPELKLTPFMRWLDRGIQFDYGAIAGEEAQWFHFYTANVSVTRAAVQRLDGFDAQRFPFLYEDLDLGYRLGQAGLRLRYNPRALGHHLHPTTPAAWERRMADTATAERQWVTHRPQMPAYFHERFARAAARRRSLGAGRPLLGLVAPGTPFVGPRVWGSAETYYAQRLGRGFLERWDRST